MENYNANVQKVSNLSIKMSPSLNENYKKLESIKENEVLSKRIEEEHTNVEILLTTYTATNELLKKITEKQDVNQAYIFDILDKWAEERKIKTKRSNMQNCSPP